MQNGDSQTARPLKSVLSGWWKHWRGRLGLGLLALVIGTSGTHSLTHLEQIQARGKLLMLTINGATTYYWGPEGETGFEFELARKFARNLGVTLEVVLKPNLVDLFPALENGQGDFIAANLTSSAERQAELRFGPRYDEVKPVVVYRRGNPRPAQLDDLVDGELAIIAGSTYEDILLEARNNGLELEYRPFDNSSIEDVFEKISSGEVDYTIIDSNILALNQRFFPAVRRAFEVDQAQSLAWAGRNRDDDTLVQAMRTFFTHIEMDDRLAMLKARHYDHVELYEAVGTFHFMQLMSTRLPDLRPWFEDAAELYDLDWRLLAAVGYQESHWDPDAVSSTGVRGVMMLTRRTAEQLGVDNRRDPEESIDGGARYIRAMIDRVPERVEDPDRLWLALAAYNMGYGHLEDARRLTQARGGDPDRWIDVRESLPLLTQEQHFRNTRFGYAPGYQALHFVESIRTFYEILVWMEGREHPLIVHASQAD